MPSRSSGSWSVSAEEGAVTRTALKTSSTTAYTRSDSVVKGMIPIGVLAAASTSGR
jgi:hypothetical protein